jgi:hypothetical protein
MCKYGYMFGGIANIVAVAINTHNKTPLACMITLAVGDSERETLERDPGERSWRVTL